MAKAVVILLVVVEIDGATNACTDGRLLVTDAAAAIMPANAAAAAVGRLTIVGCSFVNARMREWRMARRRCGGMDDDETKEH